METKKTAKASLENKRSTFFKIGLVISLFLVFCAFEWTFYPTIKTIEETGTGTFEEDQITRTFRDEEIKKPKPKIIIQEIKIIDDNQQGDTTSSIFDADTSSTNSFYDIPIDTTKEKEEPMPEWKLDRMADFVGGEKTLREWLSENLKYPKEAVEMGIEGKIYVQFVVNRTGKVTDIVLLKKSDIYLDKEALRVVSIMPDWKPGIFDNKPVDSYKILPIKFILTK